jgi:signal transduction histidine kinase
MLGVRFLMSFRARLMVLLTAFLLITIGLVIALDKWAQKAIDEEVGKQNRQVRDSVDQSIGAFADAQRMAMRSLNSEDFLYDQQEAQDLPPTIRHIIVAKGNGEVTDSNTPSLVKTTIVVPKEPGAHKMLGDPVEIEPEFHGGLPTSYYTSIETNRGLYWIVIVEDRKPIINQLEDAFMAVTQTMRRLSLIRILSTGGLLSLALLIAVVIGWRFTQPVNDLAWAARRVAAGDLDFEVPVERPDEVGQLAATFNEMIAELKYKRELEEKLNQAERAAVIGRLTQSIAHEIRNPLNVLNLSIDHAATKLAPEDEVKRKQFTRILSSVKDEIGRLNRMVNDVLNYGRPASLGTGVVDMRRLVEETATLIRPQADEQGVEVTVEPPADGLAATVRGDAERLKSCLSNIAINALQAMPAGGRLTARVEHANGAVEVSIEDTGPGISEDAIHKIFEPYYSTKQAGFGLGLAVTKKIVEDHHGSIYVESRLEQGTIFTLSLPAADDGSATGGQQDGTE